MMNKAYSVLTVKGSTETPEGMTIEGIASTPQTDRVGDIVEPLGAKFQTPMPLFMHHDSKESVGRVEFAKVTKDGIPFRAFLPFVKEPGRLKDRVDEAIHSLKYRLIGAVSIGFKGLEGGIEFMKNGGVRYKSWEWLELSLVSIGANPGATITGIKSIDAALRGAATGSVLPATPSPRSLGALPSTTQSKGNTMSTETIRKMEAERVAKMATAKSVSDHALNEGRPMDTEEQASHDATLESVKGIDGTLDRLRAYAKLEEKAGAPVPSLPQPHQSPQILFQKKNDDIPGLAFARIMQAKGTSLLMMKQGSFVPPEKVAEMMFRDDPRIANTLKATVVAGSTVSGTWAADLVTADGGPFADFVEYLRPKTIIGRFGSGGIPSLNRVPFRQPLGIQTGGGAGYWVGEGKAKPLTAFDYDKTNLLPLKVANIVVGTMELLRDASVSAGIQFRDGLTKALQERLDTDFIDPAKTASAGVSPASITNGVSAPNSAGNDADDVRADLKTLFQTFIDANNAPTSGVWIMSSTTALSLSLMTNGLGQGEFPGISINGGTLAGLPVITSEYVPTLTAGSYVFLVNANDIWFADEGGFSVDMSTEASLQMVDTPDGSSVATVAGTAPIVSMFQTNSVAFRAERTMNWSKARSSAVAAIDTVNWGAA